MRRSTKFSVAGATAALVLSACGTGGGGGDSETEGGLCDSADGDGPSVALAYDVGGRGDQSFNDASFAGLEQAVNELDATCAEGEAGTGESEEDRLERLRGFADDGYEVIIGVGFAYSDSVDVVAPEYPDVHFAVIDGFDPTDDDPNDNVAYLTFAEHEGSFLVGVAAAMETEADHIGFVGGVNNALIQKFEAGFVAGAEAVNSDIEIDVTYIEQTDVSGFQDPAGGKAAADGMFGNGADVVFHAAGGSGSGVFDAAVEADGWAIGVDSDQYNTADDDQAERIITSMLKRVDTATFAFIESIVDGDPLVSYNEFPLSEDGVGYSTTGDLLDSETIDEIEDYKQQIIDGDVEVPEAP